jgi:2-iminobutanoate/2-iminopropanoate deaminase
VFKPVSSTEAPGAIGPYSPGLRAGTLLFLSGQIPLDPATGNVTGTAIAEQTARVLDNVGALLAAGGARFSDVAKTTVYLTDLAEFGEMNAVYAKYFGDPPPARSTVQVSRLPRDVRIEIDVIAVLG